MASEPICDLKSLDFSKPLFTVEEIRQVNPQRFEMEQLTAIVHVDQFSASSCWLQAIDRFRILGAGPHAQLPVDARYCSM